MFSKSLRRFAQTTLLNWQQRKKQIFVSFSILQEDSEFKLCLNLCARKWLKPNRNLVSNLISTWS